MDTTYVFPDLPSPRPAANHGYNPAMKNLLPLALSALLITPAATANDGIASVGVGGIVFGKTDAVAMKKEVLTVSHDLITVDYEFLNETGREVEETIVFPLPPYPAARQDSEAYYGQPNGFKIIVDGQPVAFATRVTARGPDGDDVTDQLKRLGLSDAQIAYSTGFSDRPAKLTKLTQQQRRELTRLGLLGPSPSGDIDATWTVKVNYVWKQKFPANRLVRVHHAYRPFVAGGPGMSDMHGEFQKTYCVDQAYLAAREKVYARKQYVNTLNVSYILTTGNTWKRGIEDFTLNVVKRKPDELVSLCFPGKFRKVDPLTYQVRLSNFHPTQDLEVHFGNVGDDTPENGGVMPVVAK